jgi:hypothetical protein
MVFFEAGGLDSSDLLLLLYNQLMKIMRRLYNTIKDWTRFSCTQINRNFSRALTG